MINFGYSLALAKPNNRVDMVDKVVEVNLVDYVDRVNLVDNVDMWTC